MASIRIVLNARRDDPGTRVCITGLQRRLAERGIDATLNDWNHYDRYDVAVFMGYDHEMESARRQHPRIRVALADPKQSTREYIDAARAADFLMVSSVEQRDVFYRHNRNILVHYMFPLMPSVDRVHVERDTIVIGYHGNRVHLEGMYDTVRPALQHLAAQRKIEFWALYNAELLGRAHFGVPDDDRLPVRHIQWTADTFPGSAVSAALYGSFARVDIGIMPNTLPIRDRLNALASTAHPEPEFMYEPFDHLVRFKASCNPGRLYPFAQLGIPVVADFAPSASQFIRDGESGFVVQSAQAWFEALDTLAGSPALRNQMARRLRAELNRVFERQVDEFLEFCARPLKGSPTALAAGPTVEEEQAALPWYPRPRGRGPLRRILKRVRTMATR